MNSLCVQFCLNMMKFSYELECTLDEFLVLLVLLNFEPLILRHRFGELNFGFNFDLLFHEIVGKQHVFFYEKVHFAPPDTAHELEFLRPRIVEGCNCLNMTAHSSIHIQGTCFCRIDIPVVSQSSLSSANRSL